MTMLEIMCKTDAETVFPHGDVVFANISYSK